jgi:DNA-binding MurR/RpiR family transcriptional regulator
MGAKKITIIDKIKSLSSKLPPKQAELAEYILLHYKTAAFMTSTALGAASGSSESTVVRFAVSLGYSGFPEFQASLQELIQNELSTLDRFSVGAIQDESALYQKVFATEVEIMNRVLKELSFKSFGSAVDLLFEKERLVIVGFQGSSCLAEYAGYSLNKIRPKVNILNTWDEKTFNTLSELDGNSAAWIFAFPRYPMRTITVSKMLKESNIPIIGFTDSVMSPLASFTDILFTIPLKYTSYIDPFAAVMCMINSTVLGVAYKDAERTRTHLQRFEKYIEESSIFK